MQRWGGNEGRIVERKGSTEGGEAGKERGRVERKGGRLERKGGRAGGRKRGGYVGGWKGK